MIFFFRHDNEMDMETGDGRRIITACPYSAMFSAKIVSDSVNTQVDYKQIALLKCQKFCPT